MDKRKVRKLRRWITKNYRIVAVLGIVIVLIELAMVALAMGGTFRQPVNHQDPIDLTRLDLHDLTGNTPIPTQAPTAIPTIQPTPTMEPTETTSHDQQEDTINDTSYAALQAWANDALSGRLQVPTGSSSSSTIGIAGEDQKLTSPYPWIRMGYNNSNDTGRGFMWTPEKFQQAYGQGEGPRYQLYQQWLATVTPHHDVTGKLSSFEIKDNDALIHDRMVSGTISLTNNLVDDVIARVDFDIQLTRYNKTTECYEFVPEYCMKFDGITIGLVPGHTWTYTIRRQVVLPSGYYAGVVTVYDHDDDVMLCRLAAEKPVAVDPDGDGYLSIG